MGGNIDLCIIISNLPLFTQLVGVVLFGNELHYLAINIIGKYHVHKKLWKLPYTFGPETKIKY